MSVSSALRSGVAQLLHDAGIGVYNQADPSIFVELLPGSPARAIAVAHYPVTALPRTDDTVEGVQVRYRTPGEDPDTTSDLGDDIRAALDGLEHVVLGGVHVSLIAWQSGAVLGQDKNRRWEAVQNFHLTTTRPRPNSTD